MNGKELFSVEERMRQFCVVLKYAKQTGQVQKYGSPRKRKTMAQIARQDFGLGDREYSICYGRVKMFLHLTQDSATSDDMITAMKDAA